LDNLIQSHSSHITHNSQLIIAYEPVWAISRGDPSTPAATPEDAQKMHAFIRTVLATHHSQLTTIPLLYGGSMNAENAAELLAQPDIDGGLVGGASLKPEEFRAIVECALQRA
jgi:triosephosphate isomerase